MAVIYVAPDTAAVVDGQLIPGQNLIKALVDQLRDEIKNNPTLKSRFQADPRSVLSERGIVKDLQTEILLESGMQVAEAAGWCISTGSCCCSTLAMQ